MKRYFCDISGREVNASDYVENYNYHGSGARHGYLREEFKIEGYDRAFEEELDDIRVKANEAAEKARHTYIEKALAKLGDRRK